MSEYYKKWESICKDLCSDDEETPRQAIKVKDIDPKDITVGFGEPMTESEFKDRHKNMRRGAYSEVSE